LFIIIVSVEVEKRWLFCCLRFAYMILPAGGGQPIDDERRWGSLEAVRLSCHAVRPCPWHGCAQHACICIYYQYYTTLPLAEEPQHAQNCL
jgi:hypothetical protein